MTRHGHGRVNEELVQIKDIYIILSEGEKYKYILISSSLRGFSFLSYEGATIQFSFLLRVLEHDLNRLIAFCYEAKKFHIVPLSLIIEGA